MLYLILAILSSASISLIMRANEKRTGSEYRMFMANYAVCALLSLLYRPAFVPGAEGFGFSALLGCVGGALFLGAFVLLKRNLRLNGVVFSSMFMKMGVLVPTLMAVVFFGERMTVPAIIGFVLALGAIVWLNLDKGAGRAPRMGLLLLLLFVGGLTDAVMSVHEQLGSAAFQDVFLLFIFLAALLFSGLLALRTRGSGKKTDWLIGAAVGLPNYYSTRFLLLSLRTVPTVVAFPVYSASVLVIVMVAGTVFFREPMTKRKLSALIAIMAALVLLNL